MARETRALMTELRPRIFSGASGIHGFCGERTSGDICGRTNRPKVHQRLFGSLHNNLAGRSIKIECAAADMS